MTAAPAANSAIPVQAAAHPRIFRVPIGGIALGLFCAVLCGLHWHKLDSLWGDSPRWIFEAYRTFTGEVPYRDFTWQYPPLSVFLSAAALWIGGPTFGSVQALVDVLSTLLVLLTWDTGRRFVPASAALAAAAALACVGVSNGANFALFSLQIYTPAVLLAGVGVLLVIRTLADCHSRAQVRMSDWVWLAVGGFIGILAKPESAVGVLGCLAVAALLERPDRAKTGETSLWLRRHVGFTATAILPGLAVFLTLFAVCGFAMTVEGIGGYGTAALSCPWWPTGLGLFGAATATGYGLLAAALYSVLRFRPVLRNLGRTAVFWLIAGGLAALIAAVVYLPYCVAELPVFHGKATPARLASFYLSTGTVLLPVMWISIMLLPVCVAGYLRRHPSPPKAGLFILLIAPAFLISLRGLFSGTMSQLTQVSMVAYPLWFIAWPMLMLRFLRRADPGSHGLRFAVAVLLVFAAARLTGALLAEWRSTWVGIDTRAGSIRLRDGHTAARLYSFVLAHTTSGEPILDAADGGGINFAAHRSSPAFSTQFTSFTPTESHMARDLALIERKPPRIVIANEGPDFQASYGLCLNTGCPFPALVWRSTTLACDPARQFPVLEYIRNHYHSEAQFGDKVVYLRND